MRAFVLGRRDARTLLSPPDMFEIVCRCSGQSLIPLIGHVAGLERFIDTAHVESRAQRRALHGTLHADLLSQLDRHHENTDLVLWDLSEEQEGVYELGGRYISRSAEVILSGLDAMLASHARYIPFGSDEHFILWKGGLARWQQSLARYRLRDRLVLIENHGVSGRSEVDLEERYYAAARAVLPSLHVVAATNRNLSFSAPSAHAQNRSDAERGDRMIATALRKLTYIDVGAFPPPRPVVTRIQDRCIEVFSQVSWAEDVAVRALREGDAVARVPYQHGPTFSINLPAPGEYLIRAYHRSGDVVAGVNSEPVTIRPSWA